MLGEPTPCQRWQISGNSAHLLHTCHTHQYLLPRAWVRRFPRLSVLLRQQQPLLLSLQHTWAGAHPSVVLASHSLYNVTRLFYSRTPRSSSSSEWCTPHPQGFIDAAGSGSNTKLFAAMSPELAAAVAAHARRSRGGYQEFVYQLALQARQAGTPMHFRLFACAAAAQWKGMSTESRQPFFEKATASNMSWMQERVSLEARLREAGHADFPWEGVAKRPGSIPSYLVVKERLSNQDQLQPVFQADDLMLHQEGREHPAPSVSATSLPLEQQPQQHLWQVSVTAKQSQATKIDFNFVSQSGFC